MALIVGVNLHDLVNCNASILRGIENFANHMVTSAKNNNFVWQAGNPGNQ